MSALDQAIIKAFAKDRSMAASPAAVSPPGLRPEAVSPSSAHAIETLYHDGALYRVEAQAAAPRVPLPHLADLPPTSPRRSVRRSMRRLEAARAASDELEHPPSGPRIERKVIFRHIAHEAAPPPLGLRRPTGESPDNLLYAPQAAQSSVLSELPPETISDEPAAAPLNVTVAPQAAPLNIAEISSEPIELPTPWDQWIAPTLVLADAPWVDYDISPPQVSVQLEALAITADLAQADPAAGLWDAEPEPPVPRFVSKSLDDREQPKLHVRLDLPHAQGRHAPHARFEAADPTPTPVAEDKPEAVPDPQEAVSRQESELDLTPGPEAEAENEGWPPKLEELTFAEPLEQPLASDLVPLEGGAEERADADEPAEAAPQPRPALPLWEVDRFHWPRTCEKLMADEHGYLSRVGNKLLAAVDDGLRVLAITGSRRGEGRTTLALCLARAAARAGIQTAVMDADFARPQLASKIALDVAFGWQDAALGRIPLSEAAIKSLSDEITVLPLESSAATRSLSLADPRVTATIRAAAATFELLILDLGPQSPGSKIEFPAGEPCPLGAAIVVRDLRFSTASEGEAVGRMLQGAGLEAVGIAENFVVEEEIPATSV
jgi:Mrp family chromosome partitioning ATPase